MGRAQQVYSAVVCSLATFLAGTTMAWPTFTITYDTFYKFSSEEVQYSLLDSLPSLSVILGLITVGYIMEELGRKYGGAAISMCFLVYWSIVIKNPSRAWSLLAKTFAGAGCSSSMMYTTLCISEISFDINKGFIISLPFIFFAQGVLLVHLLNLFLTYNVTTWIVLSISILFAILIMTTVESPVYLIKKNKKQEALSSIEHYKTFSSPSLKLVFEEYYKLRNITVPNDIQLVPNEDLCDSIQYESISKPSSIRRIFESVSSCRMFMVLGAVIALQMLSGILLIQFYFEDLVVPIYNISANSCAVILSVVMVTAYATSGLTVNKIGRKRLLLLSSILLTVSMLSVSISTQYSHNSLATLSMLTYCFGYGLGAFIPCLLMVERFAPEVQPFLTVALHVWMWFTDYIVISIIPVAHHAVGFCGTAYAFSIFGLILILFIYFLVPVDELGV